MRSGHCWGSAGRRWLRRMTGCTPVHGNIQNAVAKAWRASSELGTDKIVTKSGALGCKPDKHAMMVAAFLGHGKPRGKKENPKTTFLTDIYYLYIAVGGREGLSDG